MVIVLILLGVIVGTVTGLVFWISGYGIGTILLAYWAMGSTTVISVVFFQALFYQLSCKSKSRHIQNKFLRRTLTRP